MKALDAGVDGLICVNARAGGHAGEHDPRRLLEDLGDLGVPLICAGGIGDAAAFSEILEMGYAGAQLGTRFIATKEQRRRGPYCGALGYALPSGEAQWSVGIRQAILQAGQAWIGVGAGIVADSQPEAEWAEVCLKAHSGLQWLDQVANSRSTTGSSSDVEQPL